MNRSGTSKFTIGIEEEYLLVDPDTGALADEPSEEILAECASDIDDGVGLVVPEFLRAQVEVGTAVCNSIKEVRAKLVTLRRSVADAAAKHELSLIAASTHPFAEWSAVHHTDKERYNVLAEDMQAVARRLLICGMHVHVGIDDDDLRTDLLNQVAYFLPHLLALSTSSPFWRGEKTGLMCYRLSVFDELPRTGLPSRFESYGEYLRHVQVLIDAGVLEDASKIWWDIRPHTRFPTLEMRIADICTRIDDGITVAALYACVISMLIRLRRSNQRWRYYANMLVNENRWRAQRYGFDEGLIDFGLGKVVPYPDLLEELIELLRPDAERLDCVAEIEHARNIVKRGTSAHRQIAIYDEALKDGASKDEALTAVVKWLMKETVAGLDM
ncbi:MAG: carboxylate-amine ligase [Rhodospirillales bacterium]|nr:MAG: carboxylate-amine ligase [Rhodospirillales bacterium]